MSKFIIKGGVPLRGEIEAIGNKNAVLKMMAASLLTAESVIIKNVPEISDVTVMADILRGLGAEIFHNTKTHTLKITAGQIRSTSIDSVLAKKLRASNTVIGPLLARCGSVNGTTPGGDKIGPREMNAHFEGLSQLGACVSLTPDGNFCIKGKLKGNFVFLYEPSVTATENIMMAAALAPGKTVISNAASEPHVRALAEMLVSMGAIISGGGTNQIIIEGVKSLSGTSVSTPPDLIYAGTMAVLSVVSGGSIAIRNVPAGDMKPFEYFFAKLGVRWNFRGSTMIVPEQQSKKITDTAWARSKGIYSQPWPCFPSDMMSLMIVLATQTKGSMLFFEKMYPGRMFFADYLNGMGANIIIADPHRVIVNGPTHLRGSILYAPDLRAGMAYVAAGLVASGTTTVQGIEHIDRGYPNIERTLRELGAEITRISS